MKQGTLSVVICNYNHAHYLPEALQAILDQSYRPLEVIVIDDGSTDNSVEVLEGFARKDPIVRLYRNEQNQGIWFSADRGLSLATGEYIYFATADDRIYPSLFEKSMELLTQYPQAGLCSALVQLLGEDGEDKGWIKSPVISKTACFLPPEEVVATLIRYGFWFTGQTTICRRDAILREASGFIPELRHYADHFVDMVVALRDGACFIPEVLATWRVLDAGYAETNFNNAALSRTTFEKITQLMRSPKYDALFPEEFMKVWEWRGRYGFEMCHFRRLLQNQTDFLGRLRELRPKPTLLDRVFFAALKLLMLTMGFVAKTYLWHRRINWDFPWVVRMLRSSYSRHADRIPPHRK